MKEQVNSAVLNKVNAHVETINDNDVKQFVNNSIDAYTLNAANADFDAKVNAYLDEIAQAEQTEGTTGRDRVIYALAESDNIKGITADEFAVVEDFLRLALAEDSPEAVAILRRLFIENSMQYAPIPSYLRLATK